MAATPSTYLTIDGLLRKHASEDGDMPMFAYPKTGPDDYEIYTLETVDRFVDAACWWYAAQGVEEAVSFYFFHVENGGFTGSTIDGRHSKVK
jgi:hypothetical protein